MTGPVSVVGVDGRPLTREASERLAAATLVIGGARHLDAVSIAPQARRVVLGEVSAGLDALAAHHGPAVALASGDPGFFGIARLMRERGIACEIFPAVGSVAALAARAGVTWDDAVVLSAHGRGEQGLRRAVNVCRARPKVAILTASGSGPAELGAGLSGHPRRLLVGEQLGGPAEALTSCSPDEAAARSWTEPNVVLVLDDGAPPGDRGWAFPGRQPPHAWALDEAAFEHRDGMVTKSEVRAVALARLGPGLGDLVWDIGAGCGSVTIECARFGAAVSAVECDAAQCERISRNATAFGVDVHVVAGRAPAALATLADPDAVFIGGGGADAAMIAEAASSRRPRAIVVALAALERVAPVTEALRSTGYATGGVQLSAARLAALPGVATRLAAQNPVFVVWGER